MKLDQHSTGFGHGKYALVRMREYRKMVIDHEVIAAFELLKSRGLLEVEDASGTQFFVIKLQDKYAPPALKAYSAAALADHQVEYGMEILDLVVAALKKPSKRPD